MAIVTFTAFMKDDDGHGWSETHNKDSGSAPPDVSTLLPAFDDLMNKFRVPLLCADTFYIGSRCSFKGPNNANAGDNIERDPPQRGPQTYLGTAITSTAPEASVKMRLRNAAATAKSDVYLRGFPKQVIDAGVLDITSPVGSNWKANADKYANALIQGSYGWVGINPLTTPRGTVTGYTRNTDGTVTFNVTPTNGIAMPVAGTKLTVKFSKINRSKSVLNRSLVCVVDTGAAAVTCEEVIACDEFQTNGHFIAAQIGFIPYAALSYYRLAKRKTGRVFGVGPGRLPAQIRH